MKPSVRSAKTSAPRRRKSPGALIIGLTIAAGLAAVIHAIPRAWVTDDAYISFRYAAHLVRGEGLVFNPGERVEGYSNFLWTLWCALGMRLGFEPDRWANAWSLAAYVTTVLLLGGWSWNRRHLAGMLPIPLAAVLLALHREAAVFATGGLETAAFTLFASAGFLLLAGAPPGPKRCALASALLALATLTRLDGLLFLAVGGIAVPFVARQRARATAAFLLTAAALLLPYLAWKWSYYGGLLPNTYHAKSATAAWWSQGAIYLGLYLLRYPALAVAIPLSIAALIGAVRSIRGGNDPTAPEPSDDAGAAVRGLALPLAAAGLYALAVVRVGGDFMFGRLLLPVTPLVLAALEVAIGWLGRNRPVLRWSLAALAIGGIVAGYDPVRSRGIVSGIVHEESANPPQAREDMRRLGAVLRSYVEGLPVRVAFGGSQAILGYTSRARYVLETSTGLTDPELARMPIERRGRVGHEKRAPYEYLIEYRRAHFMPGTGERLDQALAGAIPVVHMELDGIPCTLLTWETPVMDSLRRRGAVVQDFPASVQDFVRAMPSLPDSVVRRSYSMLRRFYFVYGQDRALEDAIRARLGLPADQAAR